MKMRRMRTWRKCHERSYVSYFVGLS